MLIWSEVLVREDADEEPVLRHYLLGIISWKVESDFESMYYNKLRVEQCIIVSHQKLDVTFIFH